MGEMQVEIKVSGVTFEGRQEHLKKLHAEKKKPEDVRLVMEPTNPYDSNAVRVEFKIDGAWRHVGYVPKKISEDVTRELGAGSIEKVEVGTIDQVASKEVIWASVILSGK